MTRGTAIMDQCFGEFMGNLVSKKTPMLQAKWLAFLLLLYAIRRGCDLFLKHISKGYPEGNPFLKSPFEDDFPFPQVGYVSSQEGSAY